MSAQAKSTLRLLLPFSLLLAGSGGCVHRFGLPMTAVELAQHDSGPALVAYLSQDDASPAVCDPETQGPHLSAFDEDKQTWLMRGLLSGQIEPTRWQRCAKRSLRSTPPAAAAALLDKMGSGYRTLLRNAELESSPQLQRRLSVLHQLYVERPIGLSDTPKRNRALLADLQRALLAKRLGPIAARFGQELLAAVELGKGSWAGRSVDEPVIDALFAEKDEKSLHLFMNRLPQPSLRDAARRRVIRLHIAASPFAEVHSAAESVEERVMQEGNYRLSLAEHPPLRGWLEPGRLPQRQVLVRQNIGEQTATLLGYSLGASQDDGYGRPLSVLPELNLRGGLRVALAGISQPVTVCAPRKALDPSPCVGLSDVKLDSPVAYLDNGGAFRFIEQLAMRDAVELARMGDRFRLPVRIAGQPLLSIDWGLSFARPPDVLFSGAEPGGDGPNLTIDVNHTDPGRLLFAIGSPGRSLLAVVEATDAPDFHISSRGAQGATGSTGATGSSGSSGSECQNGGDGGPGGPGGDGGPGGNGGDITVRLSCGSWSCPGAVALLQQTVRSEAGAGGAGGSGGSGGPGGSGGSSRSPQTHTDENGNTVTDDPGCSGGSSGSQGSPGPDGAPGPPGLPGRATIVTVSSAAAPP